MSTENLSISEKQFLLERTIKKLEQGEKPNIVIVKPPKTLKEASFAKNNFWSTQPVCQLNSEIIQEGQEIAELKIDGEITKLPDQYEWTIFDVGKTDDLKSISNFLKKHYCTENKFQIYYSITFLNWYFGSNEENILIGIRAKTNGNLAGFIGSTIETLKVDSKTLTVANANFLCVHTKLRHYHFAELLIKELVRIHSSKNSAVKIKQGFFASDRFVPKPFSSIAYYHRPLNYKRLVNLDFMKSAKQLKSEKNIDMSEMIKYYSVDTTMSPLFIKMQDSHLKQVYDLYCEYMEKYNFYTIYSMAEFEHWFGNNKIIKTFVILDEKTKSIVDFASYFRIQYLTVDNQIIQVGQLYTYTSLKTTIYTIIKNLLIDAKNDSIDLFNATDIMENNAILNEQKFEKGSGVLHYYLYNWNCRTMNPDQIAKITF